MSSSNNFKERAREGLAKRGYYHLTQEQRLASNKKCIDKLSKITKNSYEDGERLLSSLRGGE